MAASHQVAAISSQKKEVVHPYARQYAHVYHQRYQQLAPYCWKAVAAAVAAQEEEEDKSKNNHVENAPIRQVTRILELPEGQESYVVGTLVKEAAAAGDATPLVPGSQCRASDEFFLEDDSGRVALQTTSSSSSSLHLLEWPTGAVVAVRGTVDHTGTMNVTRILSPAVPLLSHEGELPGVAPPSLTTTSTTTPAAPNYLLILSGLECGNPHVTPTSREMLLAFLQGRLGHPAAPHVSRLLVAGGWGCGSSSSNINTHASDDKEKSASTTTKEGLQTADAWLEAILATGIPCDIVPGANDPTTANWPQRPLHRSLLPRSSRCLGGALLHRAPNPYQATYQASSSSSSSSTDLTRDDNHKVVVVATDGTNVRAQQKLTCVRRRRRLHETDNDENETETDNDDMSSWQVSTVLQVMEQHLRGRHLCPVGPAHVPTMPHAEQDPMAIVDDHADDDETSLSFPRLYVTGNAPEFSTKQLLAGTATPTRLVAVPSFGHTGIAVLVDLSTLQVQLLKFLDETK